MAFRACIRDVGESHVADARCRAFGIVEDSAEIMELKGDVIVGEFIGQGWFVGMQVFECWRSAPTVRTMSLSSYARQALVTFPWARVTSTRRASRRALA
jgi:predicted deacetylase